MTVAGQSESHTLSDFRSANGDFLDKRLTDNLAGLTATGVVKLDGAAQDGMRVRASVGAGSFRREDKLKGYLEAARASTTDAEATVMKMGDGGFWPAYNFLYATDTESQIIVGVEVVSSGSDQGQLVPLLEQVGQRCGCTTEHRRVDGGYPAHEQIDAVAERTTVLAPVPQFQKASGVAPAPAQSGRQLRGARAWPATRPSSATRIG